MHRRGFATGVMTAYFFRVSRTGGGGLTGGTFECSLDGAAFASCPDEVAYTHLSNGSHVLRVRASFGGKTDPTPDELRFFVESPDPACADGVDDDGDGATDYPADRGCISDLDADESHVGAALPPPPDGDGDTVPDAIDDCPSQAGPVSNQGCPVTGGGDPDPTRVLAAAAAGGPSEPPGAGPAGPPAAPGARRRGPTWWSTAPRHRGRGPGRPRRARWR